MPFVFTINDAGTPSYRVMPGADDGSGGGGGGGNANEGDGNNIDASSVTIGGEFRFKMVTDVLGVRRLVLQVRTVGGGGQWQTRQIFE